MGHPESPQFTAIAPHYDALMRGVPYRNWVRYIEHLLDRYAAQPRRVLDLACGTGNVAEILARLGYEVVGVDISEPMIAEARRKAAQRNLPIEYHVQDAARLDLSGPHRLVNGAHRLVDGASHHSSHHSSRHSPFDLCVSLFDSLNYILNPADLARAAVRVFAHLRPGGLFIFDINSAFALENGFFDQANLLSNDRLRYVWRSEYDPGTRLCRVAMRFFLREQDGVDREFHETHLQFAYREDELHDMLTAAGFDQIETFHAYTLNPVRPTTDRIFFAAQRPQPQEGQS